MSPKLLACLAAIAATTPSGAHAFGVKFSWAGIPACGKTSPEFHLSAVPRGATRLRFEMQDLNVPAFHHGGSTVAFTGETVKQGAIRYIGPCPPGGERHRYRWTVEALDASGKTLAATSATATFPP
ncbi:MAG TPA: YbhB/YbcL family Raf kinase inhibitor-like protein [Pseudolabrys sp.]|nr:YbhB/YbcL family Raf kinase inhibitor-like protein [Pseudolabrys sp.]